MLKRLFALFLTAAIFLSGVCFAAEETDEVRAALDALLIGVGYPSELSEPVNWSDTELRDTVYHKLLWDDYLVSENSYLPKAGLTPMPSENRYLHFGLESIQVFTRSVFGAEFPSSVRAEHIFTSDGALAIARETGDRTLLRVQDHVERDGTVVAVGVGVRQFDTHAEFLGCFEAVFAPSSESVYGYTLLSIKPIEDQKLSGLSAHASSELNGIDKHYRADYAIDADRNTAWAEGVSGAGAGQWLQIEAAQKICIGAIGFSLGEQKNGQISQDKGRPYQIALEFENGAQQEAQLQTFEDVIVLDQPTVTSWVRITILDALEGERHSACAISEIRLHGIDAPTYFPELQIPETTEAPTAQESVEPSEAPTEPTVTEESTEAPTAAAEEAPRPVNTDGVNTLIWVVLGAIVLGGIACFIILIVLLKKKGGL